MKDAKEPGRGNSTCKGPEVGKNLSAFKELLRKAYGIGCRNKWVTGAGTGDFGMVWDKLGEVGRALVEDYVLGRDMKMGNHCWI